MTNPYLIGDRIYLRPLERADAPTVVAWFNDPEVRRYLQVYRPMSVQAEEEFLEKLGRDETHLALGIALKETDQLIGAAGLKDIDFKNRHAAFGITIGVPTEWGKGHGTEATALIVRHAFLAMNLNRVWLHVYEFNTRGMRAYEKVGFRKEGVLRQDTYRDGRYWDTIVMGILRADWEARQHA